MDIQRPKIAEDFFSKLLHDTAPIEGVSTISQFWGSRLNQNYERYSLTIPEYHVQLCLNYTGHVCNGGHLQYFEAKGIDRTSDTIQALIEAKASEHADALRKAYEPLRELPQCDHFSPDEIELLDASVHDLWDHCDDLLYTADSAKSIDALLQIYLRENQQMVLVPERS